MFGEIYMDKKEALRTLSLDIKSCKKCPLCHKRDQVSLSRGNPYSPLMIIGDIPREADHKSGEILKGRAGKKIDKLLTDAGIKPDNVFYSSLLRCFPGRMGHFPKGDWPGRCFNFLHSEIKIVQPLIVILAGPEALTWTLLRGSGEKAEPLIEWIGPTIRRRDVYGETRFMVIQHPSTMIHGASLHDETQTIRVFETAKKYIVSRQNNEITPDISVIDIKKKIVIDKHGQLEAFKWVKPIQSEELQDKEPESQL